MSAAYSAVLRAEEPTTTGHNSIQEVKRAKVLDMDRNTSQVVKQYEIHLKSDEIGSVYYELRERKQQDLRVVELVGSTSTIRSSEINDVMGEETLLLFF